jgi:hypothetical protein
VNHQSGAFSIGVPAGWQTQQQPNALTAVDPTQRANIMVVVAPRQAQSVQQFAQAAIAQWRQTVPGWKQVGMQQVQVGNAQALHIRATGQPGGVAHMADYLLVLGAQRQFMVMLSCPQQEFQQRLPLFQQVMQSLRVQ